MSHDPPTYLWPTGHGGTKQAALQLVQRRTDMSGQSQQTQQLLQQQQQQQFLQQQHQLQQQQQQLLQQPHTHTQQHETYQVISTFPPPQHQATLRYNPYTTVAAAPQTHTQTQAYTLSDQRIAWPQQAARIGETIISDSAPFSSDLTYSDSRGITHYTVAQPTTTQVIGQPPNTLQQQMLQPAYYDYAPTQADPVQQITAHYTLQQPAPHPTAQHPQPQPSFSYHTYSINSTGHISANPPHGTTLVKIEAPQGFQNNMQVNDSLTNPIAVAMAVRRRSESTPVLHPSKITTGGKPGLGGPKAGPQMVAGKQRTVSASTVPGVSPQPQLVRSSPQQRVLTGYVPGQQGLGLPYGVQVTRQRASLGAMDVSPGLAASYQLQALPQSAGLHLATTGHLRQGDPMQTYLESSTTLPSYTPGARALAGNSEDMDTTASPQQSSQHQPPLPLTPPAPSQAPLPQQQKEMGFLLSGGGGGGGGGSEGGHEEEGVVVKIPRGVTTIEQIIDQWEKGEGPNCPALKDWTIGMRRRERSIYSQRKKLYEEYQRLGSVEAFNSTYKDLPIGKVYAVVSSRNRKLRQEGAPEPTQAGGQQTADEQDDDMSVF